MTHPSPDPNVIPEIVLTILGVGDLTATALPQDVAVGYQLSIDGAYLGQIVTGSNGRVWIAKTPAGDRAGSAFNLLSLLSDYATAWVESARAGSWPGNGKPYDTGGVVHMHLDDEDR